MTYQNNKPDKQQEMLKNMLTWNDWILYFPRSTCVAQRINANEQGKKNKEGHNSDKKQKREEESRKNQRE